jgi:hypothetical protein
MKRRVTVMLVTTAAVLLIVADGYAQPRWGRPEFPRTGACFYRDADFRGDYFCVRGGEDIADMPNGMNDQITAIRVFGGVEVTIFQDGRFRGRSARYNSDVRNLGNQGWNDRLSSIRVRGGGSGGGGGRPPEWGNPGMPREGACFFEDADFRGRSFCLQRGGSYSTLRRLQRPHFFDPGRAPRVTIFVDIDFHGQSLQITSDMANLGGFWNDKISSCVSTDDRSQSALALRRVSFSRMKARMSSAISSSRVHCSL